jgi:hypothetical protein
MMAAVEESLAWLAARGLAQPARIAAADDDGRG